MTFTDRLDFPDAPIPLRFYIHQNVHAHYERLIDIIEHALWFACACDDLGSHDFGIGIMCSHENIPMINFRAYRISQWPETQPESHLLFHHDRITEEQVVYEEHLALFVREEDHRKQCFDPLEYYWSAPSMSNIRKHIVPGIWGAYSEQRDTPRQPLRVFGDSDVEQSYQV